MTRTMLTIAAAMLTIPAVASAEPKVEGTAVAAPGNVVRAPRYCVVETPTGSLIQRRTCKSLEGWLAEGFDQRAKK